MSHEKLPDDNIDQARLIHSQELNGVEQLTKTFDGFLTEAREMSQDTILPRIGLNISAGTPTNETALIEDKDGDRWQIIRERRLPEHDNEDTRYIVTQLHSTGPLGRFRPNKSTRTEPVTLTIDSGGSAIFLSKHVFDDRRKAAELDTDSLEVIGGSELAKIRDLFMNSIVLSPENAEKLIRREEKARQYLGYAALSGYDHSD